jgi:tRNA threonylcarbamoyladenosine biosynthesis protein TsaE
MKGSALLTHSADETYQIGLQFGQGLSAPCVVALFGDLGAGKTTFVRGLAAASGVVQREICSPTFTYLNIYQGLTPIYHFDLYRLTTQQEFIAAGFDEYLFSDGICCIEWSEKIISLLPKDVFRISFASLGENIREISIEGFARVD